MENKFQTFLQQAISDKNNLREDLLLQEGFDFIKIQLQDYLTSQALTAHTFRQALIEAKKNNNSETDDKFWLALHAFYLAVGDSIDHQTNHKRWLRFVNIIEDLQGYSGCQLIDDKKINSKRIKRLYLAYTLTWEHLRYIAGNENEYNPSESILSAFSSALEHNHD